MRVLITGGAGFIGSHLVERLVKNGDSVTVYDNFISGKRNFLSSVFHKIQIIEGDVLNLSQLTRVIKNYDFVYHLSANPEVRKGSKKTDLDLQQETVATYNVLEAIRKNNIKKIVFPSSMTVYGRVNGLIGEDYGPCLPISLYGAAKLACEGLISAFCETFGLQSWILRFANVIGSRATHGVIYDLINKLLQNPHELEVLGDGQQTKPYIFIDDALDGMQFVVKNSKEKVNLFNLGPTDTIRVSEIATIIIKKMKLSNVKIRYTGTPYGWVGDVPEANLDVSKIEKLGFKTKYTSRQAVELAVIQLLKEINDS